MTRSRDVRFGATTATPSTWVRSTTTLTNKRCCVLTDAADFRVDPALPYAHYVLAIALAGLGRYSDAHRELDNAVRESRRCSDDYGLQNAFAGRMRILVQEGRAAEACAIEPPDLSSSLRSMRGEVLASRALALVTLGRLAEAKALAGNAAGATTSVETRVLVAAIEAICAMRERTKDWKKTVERLVDTTFDACGVDLLVTAYRGNADLLDALLHSAVTRERTIYMLARAGDQDLVEAAGFETTTIEDPVSRLSPREREVYELMCDGLSNGEIGTRLFITEGTVKVHVQHVFDKLGIRSRTALALSAARDRRRHAI